MSWRSFDMWNVETAQNWWNGGRVIDVDDMKRLFHQHFSAISPGPTLYCVLCCRNDSVPLVLTVLNDCIRPKMGNKSEAAAADQLADRCCSRLTGRLRDGICSGPSPWSGGKPWWSSDFTAQIERQVRSTKLSVQSTDVTTRADRRAADSSGRWATDLS